MWIFQNFSCVFQFDEKSSNIKETVQIILYTQNATAQSAGLSKNKTKGIWIRITLIK